MQQLKTRLAKWIKNNHIYQSYKLSMLAKLNQAGLPQVVQPAVKWMLTKQAGEAHTNIFDSIEQRRQYLAEIEQSVEIWYSPRPGSAGVDPTRIFKPAPGNIKSFSMRQIAHTGKDRDSAAMLFFLANAQQSQYVLELGACAGLSAAYLANVSSIKQLWTVEGAPNLAKIANETLAAWSNKAKVFTGHFDDAIDAIAPKYKGLWDLVYIDGHHEKIATIHYFNRLLPFLKPGAMVIFDDISWSKDMRDGWDQLKIRTEFSDAIDFGGIGVCLLRNSGSQAATHQVVQWNLQPVLGKHKIGSPKGWQN